MKKLLFISMVLILVLMTACGGGNTVEEPAVDEPVVEEPVDEGGLKIPDIVEGKFNVAFVLLSNHDDGGCDLPPVFGPIIVLVQQAESG